MAQLPTISLLGEDAQDVVRYAHAAIALQRSPGDGVGWEDIQATETWDSSLQGRLHPACFYALQQSDASRWSFLAQLSDRLDDPAVDAVGLEIVLGNKFLARLPDGFDPAVVGRRMDAALEMIGASFAGWEVLEVVEDLASDLNDAGRTATVKALKSRWLADGLELAHEAQAFATGIYIPFLSNALRHGQDLLGSDSPDERSYDYAETLVRVLFEADRGNLVPARDWGHSLQEELVALSVKSQNTGLSSPNRSLLAVNRSALELISRQFGDDDPFILEVAPPLVGMSLSDAQFVADIHGVHLDIQDVLRESGQQGRVPRRASNWQVESQSPEPGSPLAKRRNLTVEVSKKRWF